MSCGIYKFTNKNNNKSYIGQSINIEKRFKEHLKAQADSYFHRALIKYGIEEFDFSILEILEPSQLNEREKYWIQYYDSFNNGYNLTLGGEDNPSNHKDIVEKRTHKLLYDKEVNKKLHISGERNPNHKLTEEDVKQIRTAYAQNKPIGEVYPLYADKVGYSAFQYCWLGKTWKNIMPEVYQQRNSSICIRNDLTPEIVKNIRQEYMSGKTQSYLEKKYNKSYETMRRILKLDRWKMQESIPDNYLNFLNTKK